MAKDIHLEADLTFEIPFRRGDVLATGEALAVGSIERVSPEPPNGRYSTEPALAGAFFATVIVVGPPRKHIYERFLRRDGTWHKRWPDFFDTEVKVVKALEASADPDFSDTPPPAKEG